MGSSEYRELFEGIYLSRKDSVAKDLNPSVGFLPLIQLPFLLARAGTSHGRPNVWLGRPSLLIPGVIIPVEDKTPLFLYLRGN
jgi:hypothetical protein